MRYKNIYRRPDGKHVASKWLKNRKSAIHWGQQTCRSRGWKLVYRVRLVRYVDTSESQV